MAHLLAERAAESELDSLNNKYERSMELATKTDTGTTSMSAPHHFKNNRAVTDEERKRQTHYDKRVSHDQEVLREQRERDQQNRDIQERERERREAERRASSNSYNSSIPTGPRGPSGFSGGHHQPPRSFHGRDSLGSTTVTPSPRDRGVLGRKDPLVVTVPAHGYNDDKSLSRRGSEQFSPHRHRLAPKPVIGEKNEVAAVDRNLQEEEKLAIMLKHMRSYSEIAASHMEAEKEYKAATQTLPAFETLGKKYEGVQKTATVEVSKALDKLKTAKKKAEDVGHDIREVIVDLVRHEMSQYNIQKQDSVSNATSAELEELKKQVADLSAKLETMGKMVEKQRKPTGPDLEVINLQRRCDDLHQKIDSRKDYTDRINKAEMDISHLNIFKKNQEKTNEGTLEKFKKVGENMGTNRDDIDKTKALVLKVEKKHDDLQKTIGETLAKQDNSIKSSEEKLSELLEEFKLMQDKVSSTVTEAEELKKQLEGRQTELKTTIDGMKQTLDERLKEEEVKKMQVEEKDAKLAAHLMKMNQHVTTQGRCLLELEKDRDDRITKHLAMLKAIDNIRSQVGKTSKDVREYVDRNFNLLAEELNLITKAPAIEATDEMILASQVAQRNLDNATRIKQERVDEQALAEENRDDDWQSDPKYGKFAEYLLSKLRDEVNPDIFNPERLQSLRNQIGVFGDKLNRLESSMQEMRRELRQNLLDNNVSLSEKMSDLESKIAQQLGLCEGVLEEATERLDKIDQLKASGLPVEDARPLALTNGHVTNNEIARDMPTRLIQAAMPSLPSPRFVSTTPPLVRSDTPKGTGTTGTTTPREPPTIDTSRRDSVFSTAAGTPPPHATLSPRQTNTPTVVSFFGSSVQSAGDSRWRAVPSLAGHKRPRAAEDEDDENRVTKKDST